MSEKQKWHVRSLKPAGLSLGILIIQTKQLHSCSEIKLAGRVATSAHVIFTDFSVKLKNVIFRTQTVGNWIKQ